MTEKLIHQTQSLPEAEAVMEELLHGVDTPRWDHFRDDYEGMKIALDEIAPIQTFYIPTKAPTVGEAPLDIREQWVGLHLPVRSKNTTEEFGMGFTVMAREALEELKQARPEAYNWWRNFFIEDIISETKRVRKQYEERHGQPAPDTVGYINNPDNEFDEYIVNFEHFTFDPKEGILYPVERYLGSLMAHDALFAETYGRQQSN